MQYLCFLVFKNIKIPNNKLINKLAASTFGILLIHTNSATMRSFLWETVFKNVKMYTENYLILHAIGAVLMVYFVCLLLDCIRISFIEKPLFAQINESKALQKIENIVNNKSGYVKKGKEK